MKLLPLAQTLLRLIEPDSGKLRFVGRDLLAIKKGVAKAGAHAGNIGMDSVWGAVVKCAGA